MVLRIFQPVTGIALSRVDRFSDHVAVPWQRTRVRRAIRTIRISCPVEIQAKRAIGRRNETHESARGVRAVAIGAVSEEDLEVGFVSPGHGYPEYPERSAVS